jgi:hypothetical protein
VTTDLFLDLVLLAALLGLGALVARTLVGAWDATRVVSLAFPIGSGLLTWLIFLGSWAGFRIALLNVALIMGMTAAVCVGLLVHQNRKQSREASDPKAAGSAWGKSTVWVVGSLGALAVLWLAVNAYLAVAQSYSLWDAIAIWSVKGYGIALEGSVFAGREWGGNGLAYPLNIPMLVSLFTLAGGDPLPASKVIFPLYFASLLVGVYRFSRTWGMRRELAGLAVLYVASIPVLYTDSTTGYANAPMTAYLVLGGLTILEGAQASSSRNLVTGGVLLGLASWTRAEGVAYAAAILVSGLMVLAFFERARAKWLWALVPLVVIIGPWLVFYRLHGGDVGRLAAGAISSAFQALLSGQWHLGTIRLILQEAIRALVDVKSWGWVWPLSMVLVALLYPRASRTERAGFLAAAAMCGASVLVTIAIFYIGSFGIAGLRTWLATTFRRELLPSPLLLFASILPLLAPSFRSAADGLDARNRQTSEADRMPPL